MKFVWKGWYDSYDSLKVPTLLDEQGKIVWQGKDYYNSEISEKIYEARRDLEDAAKKFKVTDYDFSSNCTSNWNLEDQRSLG